MSYLDRRSNRPPSRRSPEQQQQHSPFGRRGLYDTTEDFEIPPAHGPSSRNSPRHRRYTSQTGTLRGAFEATRVPAVSEQEDEFAYARGSPSPSRNQMEMNHSLSPQSNPPEELVEAYRRMREDHDLVDPGDLDIALRTRYTSPGAARGGYGEEDMLQDPFMVGDEASFLDEVTDESPRRRKHADHVNDERRLRRATTSQSPVFSRAWTGSNPGLTSEDLQRRETEDEFPEHYVEEEAGEDDRGPEPSLNFPSTWGSRATNSRNWMRNIGWRSDSGPRKEVGKSTGDSALRSRPRLDSSTNSPQTTAERSPRRTSIETRNALKERSTAGYNRAAQSDEQTRQATEQIDQQPAEGGQIPNTPISVYKNSTFSRRSPAKRDSQDLLRRLSRAESPRVNGNPSENQIKTPEPTKPFEGRIYDKTPIVTGAWIDTPMTEKVTELPEHLTRDIIPPPAEKKEAENAPQPQRLGGLIGTKLPPIQEKETESTRERPVEKIEEQKSNGIGKAEEKKEPEKTKPPVIKPDLPRSGLETLIRNSQADEDQPLGDDTLESLEKLIEDGNQSNKQNGQPTEVKSEEEEDAAYKKAILKKLEGTTPQPDSPVDLDQFHGKLESLSRNMNELKAGFQGFEDRLKQDSDIISRATNADKASKHAADCKICGAHNDGRVNASIPLPYLWRRDPISRRIRPTRLAWCLSIFILWLLSESTMCDYYCHPTYATVCEGNCLKPDAPQFPYVIPTMLWRWSHLSSFLAPVFTFVMAVFKFVAQLMGFWDGYVDDGPPRALDLAGEIRIRGTRIAGVPVAATQNPNVQQPQQQPWQTWHGQTYRDERPESGSVFRQDAPLPPPPVHWGDEQSLDDDELL